MFGIKKPKLNIVTTNIPLTTNKGRDIVLHSVSSLTPDSNQCFRLEAYLREKYNASNPDFSREDYVGSLSGSFYKNFEFFSQDARTDEVIEYLNLLKKDKPEYYITLINIDDEYKNQGIGSTMLELSEYIFAKYLKSVNKPVGVIDGMLVPMDMSKEAETRKFYEKNGFNILETKNRFGRIDEDLYKEILAEEVMDRPSRELFERTI